MAGHQGDDSRSDGALRIPASRPISDVLGRTRLGPRSIPLIPPCDRCHCSGCCSSDPIMEKIEEANERDQGSGPAEFYDSCPSRGMDRKPILLNCGLLGRDWTRDQCPHLFEALLYTTKARGACSAVVDQRLRSSKTCSSPCRLQRTHRMDRCFPLFFFFVAVNRTAPVKRVAWYSGRMGWACGHDRPPESRINGRSSERPSSSSTMIPSMRLRSRDSLPPVVGLEGSAVFAAPQDFLQSKAAPRDAPGCLVLGGGETPPPLFFFYSTYDWADERFDVFSRRKLSKEA